MATSAFIKYGGWAFSGVSGFPVPSVSISKDYQRNGAGRTIGATVTVSLEGKIFSGSGNSGINQLLTLESGLRDRFVDGKNLEIGCGSTNMIYGSGKVARYSASRTEDNWTTTIDYSIDLQFEVAATGSGIFYVSSTQDDWNIETLDEASFAQGAFSLSLLGFGSNLGFEQGANYPFYRISRTVGAVGKYVPSTGSNGISSGDSPIKYAKEWVNYQLSQDPKYTSIINGLTLYNFVRSISTSDTEGSYRVTDNWMGVPSGNNIKPYIETFTVESAVDSSMLRTVTVNGNVKGLEPFNTGIYSKNQATYLDGSLSGSIAPLYNSTINIRATSGTKFYNAMSGYSGIKGVLYTRAQALASTGTNNGFNFSSQFGRNECPLNPIPMSMTEGFNPAEGSITYSWSYNNRPMNLISGSISETLSVDDSYGTPIIASIFVLGRKLGPILQDLGTITSSSRSVTFEVVFPRPSSIRDITFPTTHYKTITGIVETFNPTNLTVNTNATQGMKSFVKTDTSNWNLTEGRLTKTKAWEWVKCYE